MIEVVTVRRRIHNGSERIKTERDTDTMKKVFATIMSVAFLATYGISEAQTSCPPEVAKAKQMLQQKSGGSARTDMQTPQAPRSLAGARGQDVQAARGQDVQAPRGQDAQAPRGQDVQAPRGQDVQAPRGQDVQAPRGQDVQAPRGQDVQAARGKNPQAARGQDVQAPRGQDVQAPRGQDVQAPRGQDVQAPRSQAQTPRATASSQPTSGKAWTLVKEAEAACKSGDMQTAKAKADAAIAEIK
jgi:hypothetical protein